MTLKDELFGDNPNDGLTGMERNDIKKIVREYHKATDKEKLKKNVKKQRMNLKIFTKKSPFLIRSKSNADKKKYSELSYNSQLTTDKNQIIITNEITQDKHDANQFIPQIKISKKIFFLNDDTKVAIDCGYSSGENIKFAEDNNLDLYVPSRAQAQVFDGKKNSLLTMIIMNMMKQQMRLLQMAIDFLTVVCTQEKQVLKYARSIQRN